MLLGTRRSGFLAGAGQGAQADGAAAGTDVVHPHGGTYFIAMPCGRAGPVGKAVLKSRLKRSSSVRLSCVTFRTSHFVVAFKVDDSGVVLIEKVVCNNQPGIIVGQHEVVRPGVLSEADDRAGNLFQSSTRSVVSSMPT